MKNKYIINFMGAPRTGKDTFIKFFGQELASKYSCTNIMTSSADIIKEILQNNFNISSEEKTEEYRTLVANMYELINNYNNSKILIKKYYSIIINKYNCYDVVFTQIRKLEDFLKLKEIAKDYKCLNYVVKNSAAEKNAIMHSKNIADKAFNNVSSDTFLIYNEGTIGQLLDLANETAEKFILNDKNDWDFI